MKNPVSLIKTLITTNFMIAGSTVLLFAMSQSFQESSVVKVQSLNPQPSYHREIKVQVSDEQQQIKEQEEKLNQQQHEIETLTEQLTNYQQSNFAASLSNSQFFPSSVEHPFVPLEISSETIRLNQILSPSRPSIPVVPVLEPPFQLEETHESSNVLPSQSQEPQKDSRLNPEDRNQQIASDHVNQANDLVAGLLVAHQNGQIRRGTTKYSQYQKAIRLLRQGENLEVSAELAQIPLAEIAAVMAWGERRPGNWNKHQPPLLFHPQAYLLSAVSDPIRHANDIAAGLLVADSKGRINHGSSQYRRVQTAIKLLRQGKTLEQASYQSKVSVSTLEQLIRWGEIRPGSRPVDWNPQISRRFSDWHSENP